jgi:hypothetical protein
MTNWFEVEQTAKTAKFYRQAAQCWRTAGNMKLCRDAEAKARQYEAALRDLADDEEYEAMQRAGLAAV